LFVYVVPKYGFAYCGSRGEGRREVSEEKGGRIRVRGREEEEGEDLNGKGKR
jgi:hypothetical protein